MGKGQDDRTEKFDRADRAQRQYGDRQIETAIHRGEHNAECDKAALIPPVQRQENPPRFSKQNEDRRGGGDPQPGDAKRWNLVEQYYRKCRTEVVKDGADQEEGKWRPP